MTAKTPSKRPAQDATKTASGLPEERSANRDILAFLDKAKAMAASGTATGNGRLVFALDATMSRQPTWDTACHLQAGMFHEVAGLGSLDVQLVYFRGYGECRASKWVRDGNALAGLMSRITCQGGHTQIRKVLTHTITATRKKRVSALVYVGDCMEEKADDLCVLAGELGMLNVPAFVFQEGGDPTAEATFREIARLTKGAYCRFDSGSAKQLGDLLRAVAVYATGGYKALIAHRDKGESGGQKLLEQLR
ncbi:MAG: VWA domain-containing protein [Pseudomonadota bacterium]